MGRYANDTGGGDFQHAPIGTHAARCIRLIDLGTQQGEWQGKPTFKNQVLVMWELPDELMEAQDDGQPRPFIVSKFYTNSLSEKANLRKDLTTWRGRDFTDDELDRFDLQRGRQGRWRDEASEGAGGETAGQLAFRLLAGRIRPNRIRGAFGRDQENHPEVAGIPGGGRGKAAAIPTEERLV
jgi:hypothetical protein